MVCVVHCRGLLAVATGGVWGCVVAFERARTAAVDSRQGNAGQYVVHVLVNAAPEGPLVVRGGDERRSQAEGAAREEPQQESGGTGGQGATAGPSGAWGQQAPTDISTRLRLYAAGAKGAAPQVVAIPLQQVGDCISPNRQPVACFVSPTIG